MTVKGLDHFYTPGRIFVMQLQQISQAYSMNMASPKLKKR